MGKPSREKLLHCTPIRGVDVISQRRSFDVFFLALYAHIVFSMPSSSHGLHYVACMVAVLCIVQRGLFVFG